MVKTFKSWSKSKKNRKDKVNELLTTQERAGMESLEVKKMVLLYLSSFSMLCTFYRWLAQSPLSKKAVGSIPTQAFQTTLICV